MRNFRNNRRRFRSNSYDRNSKLNSNDQSLNSTIGNISDFKRKNYNRNNFNSHKLIQKYSDLAREALSNGDKILYESYLQHAEHFIRISENSSNTGNEKENSSKTLNEVNISKIADEDLKKEDNQQLEKN
tara:strand:+ start:1236 stop:1625 length:390 start_codon:yes stop_codon:yes gene_type:complete